MKEEKAVEAKLDEIPDPLGSIFRLASIDPDKDTVVETVRKFAALGTQHLTVYLSNGGFICLCCDSEMGRRFRDAVDRICGELEAESANARA